MQSFSEPLAAARWLQQQVPGTLHTDSRKLKPGDGFLAWPGAATDARAHVTTALEQGASACLVEAEGVGAHHFVGDQVATYHGLKSASGPIASIFFDSPSRQIDVIAVTGTNGKTSTAWWLSHALSALDAPHTRPCAMVGTLGIYGAGEFSESGLLEGKTGLTTPDPVLLQQSLRRFVQSGLIACALEASSIGLAEHRLDGTRIDTAIFTNFTQDHLDYHGSMQAYWQAKSALFSWPALRAAVINIDDKKGSELAQQLAPGGLDLWTVSMHSDARLVAQGVQDLESGLQCEIREGSQTCHLATHLRGNYNVENLLCVIAAMRCLGVPLAVAVQACSDLGAVPGRMDCIEQATQPLVVIDYAHTPDALAKVLLALRPLASGRQGKLWCLFGCGGGRDASKRPLMGAVAASHADVVVLTSDNPRGEKPEQIISQILLGMEGHPGVEVETDRAAAIARSLQRAGSRDVVLIAGKGHETDQEVAGVRHHFSDRSHALGALALRKSADLGQETS